MRSIDTYGRFTYVRVVGSAVDRVDACELFPPHELDRFRDAVARR